MPVFSWLEKLGARFESSDIPDFGNVSAECAAALEQDVLAPLTDRAVIRARGVDADVFLQGQLSNDLRELTRDRGQLSSYSSPKGRVIAVLTLMRRAEEIWLETDASIAADVLKRLRQFVMRSKLKLDQPGPELAALGLSGPNAAAILEAAGLPAPQIVLGCASASALTVVRRADAGPTVPRYSVHGSDADLALIWSQLAEKAKPVGTSAWHLLDILAGLPAIHPDTREQHVAQMLNLDTLEGISFAKGCYPGQEIVARLHYLGSLKRRMFNGYSTMSEVPRTMPVFVADGSSNQPVGEVLDSAPHPEQGRVIQVVLQLSHHDAPLRLGSVEGPELRLAVS